MTSHTPATWEPLRNGIEIQSDEGMHEIHACVGGVPVPVAQVWPTMDIEHDDPGGEYRISEAEGLANLHLIAAAPDLLTALESAYEMLADIHHEWPKRSTREGQRLLCQLRDAISKATDRDTEDVQNDFGTRSAISKAKGQS